ncbi:MAG: hypothetical protein J0M08_13795 [Bacteroidetes bacterium]|nr:hypothetical protein [Bacteroidota bacterium]
MRYLFMRFYLLFILVLEFFCIEAQIPIGIGQWRDHLPYKSALSVCTGNGKMYCATTGGLFSYNLSDNSIERYSKVNGLSDMKLSTVNFNTYNNTLLIGYENGNLDVLVNDVIINVSDIKRESDMGNKRINSVYFHNKLAYLACGFGIVVFDTEKKEIKDTYKIGLNGALINVHEITIANNTIFAATENGVYSASLLNPNLIYFGAWTKVSTLPVGIYNSIVHYNNHIYVNYSKNLTNNAYLQDTLFDFDLTASTWGYFKDSGNNTYPYNNKSISVSSNKLIICSEWGIYIFDTSLNLTKAVSNYKTNILPTRSLVDNSGNVWASDLLNGLVKESNGSFEFIIPNGPNTVGVYNMDARANGIWAVPGATQGPFHNTYTAGSVSVFKDETWTSVSNYQSAAGLQMDSLHDLVSISVDPKNENHYYAASYRTGVLEFTNNNLVKKHSTNNSTLQSRSQFYYVGVGGSAFDEDGNLWVTNSNVSSCLHVRKRDGTWQGFNFFGFDVDDQTTVFNLYITSSGQKWINLPSKGMLVFDDKGTFAAPNASNSKRITNEVGKGALPSNFVYCMAEDQSNHVWVGTAAGVAVFYSPESIFSGDNWDSQQILIEQDGHVQKLLETEAIKAIAIDGANRKWIGTQNSGVFLLSEDGQKEIHHFTQENSPLLSNEIASISINHQTGEVFFGTSNGLVSYRSTATEGLEEYDNVYAYPNPVKESYDGTIAIKGLVKDVDVRITDVAGRLVYKTKALGGQAIWNGRTTKGNRVKTGVYLAFMSDEEGDKTFVTKILVIN